MRALYGSRLWVTIELLIYVILSNDELRISLENEIAHERQS